MKKLLIIAVALATAGALAAKKYPHADSGVVVDIPGSWEVTGDDHSLNAATKDGLANLSFIIMPAESVEAAMNALDAELGKAVQNLTHGAGEDLTINGMQAHSVDGKGTVEGNPVEIGVMIIKTPKDKILVVFGIVSEEGAKKHHNALVRILKGIKPLK